MDGVRRRVIVVAVVVVTSDPLTVAPSVRLYNSAYTVFTELERSDTCTIIQEFAREVVFVAEFLACVSRSCGVDAGMYDVIFPLLTLVYDVEAVVISPLVMAVPAVAL